MAWKERSRMDKRMLLVGEYLKGETAMTELCREFGISRRPRTSGSAATLPMALARSRIAPVRLSHTRVALSQWSSKRSCKRAVRTLIGVHERSWHGSHASSRS